MKTSDRRARLLAVLNNHRTIREYLRELGCDEDHINRLSLGLRRGLCTRQTLDEAIRVFKLPPTYFMVEDDFEALEILRQQREDGDE